MKENIPRITCPKCNGSGLVSLPESLLQTLRIVEASPGLSTMEVFGAIPNGPDRIRLTAVSNRLAALLLVGMVRREGWGKSDHPYRWYPVERGQTDG